MTEFQCVVHRALTYFLFVVLMCVVASTGYYYLYVQLYLMRPTLDGSLRQKLLYYKDHTDDYNFVFIGDSRTLTDIHPDLLDARLGTQSVNLAGFSHWFPTQYPFVKDLVPMLVPGTTIVWAIGHQNFFSDGNAIPNVYPIPLVDMLRYIEWGFPVSSLSESLLTFNPFLRLYGDRGKFHARFLEAADKSVFGGVRPNGGNSDLSLDQTFPSIPTQSSGRNMEAPIESARDRFSHYPNVDRVEVLTDGDRITSVALYKKYGSYLRVELDHEYFRGKQREYFLKLGGTLSDEEARLWPVPTIPDPAYWRLFLEMLDLFKNGNVRLIVLELEEAPHVYRNPIVRERYREIIWNTVRPTIEKYGFQFMRLPLDQLQDADYFDWNHLNSEGVEKLTPMLAQALKSLFVAGTSPVRSLYTLQKP
jgi:hypothetical protein